MPASITSRTHATSRVIPILASAGFLLWLAGLTAAFVHSSASVTALRVLGFAFTVPYVFRRRSLMWWTLFSMLAGIELGLDVPRIAAQIRLPGDLFLRLIRMIVAPLLFATITTGIAGHAELRSVGRVAIKALVYFEVVTTLGLIIGVIAINLSGAGWGVGLPAGSETALNAAPAQNWQQVVLNAFPENIAQAVAQNQILQVAIFSVLFGAALALLTGERRAPLVRVLQSLADTMFRMTRFVMYLAPLAAGSAVAYTVGSMGVATLLPLARLVVTYYCALAAFLLLVMLPILLLFRIPLRGFAEAVGEPAAIGFATTTSEAALPLAMERMEQFGVPRWIVSFVIPTGYSFNMTGSSVYLSMAAVFAAQASGIHLSTGQEVIMLATLMLASKGVAGVPRAVLVVLLATASAIHIPSTPFLLILGVDTLMDMGRTMMNVVGNCMASAVVARTERSLAAPDGASLPQS